MSKIVVMIIFLVSLIVSAKESYAKVSSIGIGSLIENSEYIVLGRCQTITEIEGVRVAKIEVIKTIKGEQTNELYYLAESTWACDVSGATIGETALYFFNIYKYDPNAKPKEVLPEGHFRISDFEEPVGFRQTVELLNNQIPFLQIAHAGRGKMPLSIINGLEYITLYTDDVILPNNIKTIPGSEKKYSSFIRSVQLKKLLLLIEKELHNHKN